MRSPRWSPRALDNRDIAARLFLSEGTVRNRISAILDKLGPTNRTQLAIPLAPTPIGEGLLVK